MATIPSITRTSRPAARLLMLTLLGLGLLACAGDRTDDDPNMGMRANSPFLGFDRSDGGDAGVAG